MKTPEEIKRGLECCAIRKICAECPYKDGKLSEECMDTLEAEALAYIKKLEREAETCRQLEARNDTLIAKEVLFDEAIAAGAKMQRERDAAVEDLKKNSYTPCATCGKRIDNKSCTEFGERMPCDMINIFRCEMYEWRGVKED